MKTSKVLKKIEREMRAESERLYDFWTSQGGTQGSPLAQQCWQEGGAWSDAAKVVKRHRKALEVLGK